MRMYHVRLGKETRASDALTFMAAFVFEAAVLHVPFDRTPLDNFFQIADFSSRIDRLVKPKGKRIVSNGRLTTINGFTLGPDNPRPLPALAVTVDITTYLSGPAPAAAAP